MSMYEVKVYNKDKNVIHSDYYEYSDKERAELQGKEDCQLFGGLFYSVRQLRFL